MEEEGAKKDFPKLVSYPDSDSTYCSSVVKSDKDFSGSDSDESWTIPIKKRPRDFYFSSSDLTTETVSSSTMSTLHLDTAITPTVSALQSDTASTSTTSPVCAPHMDSVSISTAPLQPGLSSTLNNLLDAYCSEPEELIDEVEDSESDDEKVGKKGFRKKRPLPKRLQRKLRNLSGKNKMVQPNPCAGKKCGNGCAHNFTDAERLTVHELYWGLGNAERQKDWLLSCVHGKNVGRRRVEPGSRRSITYNYYLPNGISSQKKVCQQFLLKTLDISQMTLRYALNNKTTINCIKDNARGKSSPSNKYHERILQGVRRFIQKLPAVRSHYCRNKGEKLYLPPEFRNISFLYNKIYLLDETIKEMGSVKKPTFKKIFTSEYNIGFHHPKKDKCEVCERVKNLAMEDQIEAQNSDSYKKHIEEKDAAKKQFLEEQERSKNSENFLCASFDLEKVLTTPHGDSVNLYYSRKLAYYNETVYESGTKNGYCYLWSESDAKRGCNEVCTVVFKYLKMIDEQGSRSSLALYCDSCCGQNKNRAMLSMLSYFMNNVTMFIQKITINFLVPGHTMMPVDSVHATIESFIRGRTVWAPSQWPTLIANARISPKNYETVILLNAEILDWKGYSATYLPPSLKIPITKLRTAHFERYEKKIELKYGFLPDAPTDCIDLNMLIRSRANRQRLQAPVAAYKSLLPISKAKYDDLNRMCSKGIIPAAYAAEYKDLRFEDSTLDVLPSDED